MRFVFVSDIHGQFDKLQVALDKVQFNKDADCLVSVGDPFDRGPQSKEVLHFLVQLPHRIFLWGNHDLRLCDLMYYEVMPDGCDKHNGVPATLQSFCSPDFNFAGKNSPSDIRYMRKVFNSATATYPAINKVYCELHQYFNECYWCAEFPDLVATHGWVPQNFRNANKLEWSEAVWETPFLHMDCGHYPDKKLLIGHTHAWRVAEFAGVDRVSEAAKKSMNRNTDDWLALPNMVDCSTYEDEHLIAIDGCTNITSGLVNTYCVDCDPADVILYKIRDVKFMFNEVDN